MMTRRGFAKDVVTFMVVATTAGASRYALAKKDVLAPLTGIFAKIEAESGGRLGVAVLDSQTGAASGHRADERFPMCPTFKFLVAAAT